MGVFEFIHANYWPLMLLCVVVFVGGLILYLVGKSLQHRGERQVTEAWCRGEGGGRFTGPSTPPEYLYPPVESYQEYSR